MEKEAVIKAAKSLLKKNDGSMKLKKLSRCIHDKIGNNGGDENKSTKKIKKIIKSSNIFQVDDNKIVTVQKKRKSVEDNDDEKANGKKRKDTDTKTNKKQNTASTSLSNFESVVEWRKDNKIVVMHCSDDEKELTNQLNRRESYFPYTSFTQPECLQNLSIDLLNHCTNANGFIKPSPIQAQAWPIMSAMEGSNTTIQKGSDMVGIAETGSGKTLAFAIPALSAMIRNNKQTKQQRRFPRMLVLAPTRELAMQSDQVISEFCKVIGLKSIVLYGGVPKHTQLQSLKKSDIDCIVATPGRLKDFLQDHSCDLSHLDHLVLDEADRMLDMGFEEDVRYIISQCKSNELGRQTVMFSATWPVAIRKIAMDFMINPVRVYVGFESIVANDGSSGSSNVGVDDSLSANRRVKQTIEVIEDRQRENRLRTLLNQVHTGQRSKDRVLVFALYKKEAERLEHTLRRDGWNCCSIHGNKNQVARTEALAQFKDGTCPLLVATDVAARGLDIPNVEVVINFTFPLTIEDYVHRIGRTGRAGKTGESYTFFQPTDKSHAGELQQILKQVNQPIPTELAKFGCTIKKKEHKLYGSFGPRDNSTVPMKQPTKIKFDYDSE